jgi:catechol 2,3-dioxygenase-like lactoylglutathione lyase family enzyme
MNAESTRLKAFRPHISLDVRDLTQSVEFYSALFGQRPVKERPGYAKFSLTEPPLNFSMNEHADVKPGGYLSHLGFEVLSSEEVLEAQARLEASGISVRAEMSTTCCYAEQDKIWVSDPDGNAWEVFVVTNADAPRGGSQNGCCIPILGQSAENSCC